MLGNTNGEEIADEDGPPQFFLDFYFLRTSVERTKDIHIRV